MFNYKIIKTEINPITGLNFNNNINSIIENGTDEEFILLAKEYNIFQHSTNKFYLATCEKIRQRLQNSNLSIDLIKPEN